MDDMIWCVESPKESTPKNLLELINEFSKVAGYETNTQKSVAFPYTNNEWSKKEIKNTIASKWIKYLGINLTREVNDAYNQNFKTLLKEIRA